MAGYSIEPGIICPHCRASMIRWGRVIFCPRCAPPDGSNKKKIFILGAGRQSPSPQSISRTKISPPRLF